MGKCIITMTPYQIELSPLAQEDIENIALYTLIEYGLQQQDTYMNLLDKGLKTISENPYIGHGHIDLEDDVQIWSIAKHLIIYTTHDTENVVRVFRILHQSVDIKKHIYGMN